MSHTRRFARISRLTLLIFSAAFSAPADAAPRALLNAIEVTAPANPTHLPLKVGNFGSAIALGLFVGPGATAGELAGSAEASGRATKLTESLAGQNLRVGDELAQAMEAALKQRSFNAFAAGASQQPPSVRIVFEIEECGYERRVWGKIGPKLTVRVRVFDITNNDRVFGDTYKYDMYAQTLGWTMLRPPEEYGFEDADSVLAHPDVVAAGIRTGIRMIAERAAEDIVGEFDD